MFDLLTIRKKIREIFRSELITDKIIKYYDHSLGNFVEFLKNNSRIPEFTIWLQIDKTIDESRKNGNSYLISRTKITFSSISGITIDLFEDEDFPYRSFEDFRKEIYQIKDSKTKLKRIMIDHSRYHDRDYHDDYYYRYYNDYYPDFTNHLMKKLLYLYEPGKRWPTVETEIMEFKIDCNERFLNRSDLKAEFDLLIKLLEPLTKYESRDWIDHDWIVDKSSECKWRRNQHKVGMTYDDLLLMECLNELNDDFG